MRNPEGIDLAQYPPPVGYVVASEEDVKAAVGMPPRGWMFFCPACEEWEPSTILIQRGWTYLRPITPNESAS